MKTETRHFTTSLQFKLIAVVVAVQMIGQLLSGIYLYQHSKVTLLAGLESSRRNVYQRLAINLVEPIWNFNKAQVRDILVSEMGQQDLAGIIIYDKEQKSIFLAVSRDKDWKAAVSEKDISTQGLTDKGMVVKRGTETLGVVKVLLTKRFVDQELGRQIWFYCILFGAMVIISGVLLAYLLRVMVLKRILATSSMLQNIASGEADLTQRLLITTMDEIGVLSRWFNEFIGKLEDVIAGVKQTAVQVDTATQEVTYSAQGISQVSQEQASSIEEVAATVNQMASSIKGTVNNTSSGKEKVTQTVKTVNDSAAMADAMSHSMDGISAASKKIGDIISTVNEVAFQTNLLALNAAVEAARAGEHGRGFAVVATEVRALAQRSAEAAKEIRTLIEDTVGRIAQGDEMVKKTRQSMLNIKDRVEELYQTMEEIAASSTEQATGIDELNLAITQIDNTAQQNAATVEELAGTADSLKNEVDILADNVARFKVSEAGADLHRASPLRQPRPEQR